ncbi:synemin [Hippoglossus hippoglossus]|uniref:synemin n=1 Tax=Hippoglossus hippoglossus TaxID=8267 RepID=UPI00148E5AC9|nr:synemin [Hippoglossus hippoglossus]XP_034445108.1 synemin [Hippoglossus hippoglossus]
MLPFKRTFEGEKQQLQQLNSRLAQYLCRTKQLEQDNAHLVSEINKLRQTKTAGWEPRYKAEMRDLRGMLGQLSMEKSQAEMEREKLWRELQSVQGLCSEQTEVCRDISGELHGCEKELHLAHQTNSGLQQRLFQLESQCKSMEEAHRQDKERLRRQVDSRVVPIITQTYRGPPVASVEEVQEYARGLSEGWMETFDMYQQKVEEMEQSIRADQARLGDLQREKMLYASELDKLRTEAEKKGHAQLRLEEQLMHMQEKFHVDSGEYQMIIEQLEHDRNAMANTIETKMREHQHLLQVKMDLGMEVAAYRALLEGDRVGLQDAHPRVNQHQRERIINIKMPAHPYKPRASILTTRPHTDIRYRPQTSSLSRSPVRPSGSISPSRIIPISVASRDRYQSPESRRDMISFSKAQAAASATATATTTAAKDEQTSKRENPMSHSVQKPTAEEKTVKIKQVSSMENESSPIKSSTPETKSVRVVSPPMMMLSTKTEPENKKQLLDEEEMDSVYDSEFEDKGRREYKVSPSEKKILDSVSVEEIIEKVIRPAGLEAKVCSSGESKIRYHVEKTEQEDGTFKTQIVLESKVEEELDFSEDLDLEELMSQGMKKVSLEDIEDTATGSMIKNLLSGLQGAENLRNKSVKVEIIEEPVDSYSDEELEVEEKSRSTFYAPSSTYFQIEELENIPDDVHGREGDDDDAMKSSEADTDQSKGGSVHVQQVSRHSESSYFSHDQEPHEYFVSTPDDNLSETEDGGGMSSYGHYGIVDDLSDERYYQDESLPRKRVIVEEGDEYKFMSDDHDFVKESFPECIIEEEVCVSPVVQESVLEFLREDSLEPKDQLKGALEQLQGSVSGPLREELAFLTKLSKESPQNVAVKRVQQSSDNGTMTIVAELNVSQTLEDSGLLEEGDDLSEEQIMAAFRSSNLGFEGGAGGGYSFRISKEEDVAYDEEFDVFANQGESVSEITEKHIKLEPSEKSSEASSERELQSQTTEKPLEFSQEKRVATIYLESQDD